MPHKYFINPHTGRKCLVGGPTHRKMEGEGIPGLLAGLLLKEVGLPLAKKVVKKIRGKGLAPAGSGLKLAGQGKKKIRRRVRTARVLRPMRRTRGMRHPQVIRAPQFAFI